MVGMTAFLDGGITLDAYYQLEQKEVEIDAAGSFYGSDFVGKYASTDLMNSPNYRENKNIPFAGNYHDAATCFADGITISAKILNYGLALKLMVLVLLLRAEKVLLT